MKAIISGICGMDASYLSELLLNKGYEVIGFYRRSSTDKFDRIQHLLHEKNFHIEEGDVTDFHYISTLLDREKPDKFFNAAAQSHVGTSFRQPHLTLQVNTQGPLNILEAIRCNSPHTKLVQFSTSEMWGSSVDEDKMQRETTPFAPRSPYAVSKMAAYDLCKTYRESYNIFACSSICHNHTSPRRGDNFVEKKIINWCCNHYQDLKFAFKQPADFHNPNYVVDDKEYPKLRLGNLTPYRDFSHSADCVEAIYLMSEMDKPKDYVVASGKPTQIQTLVSTIFKQFNRDWREFVYIDPSLYRPAEVDYLCGDSSLIRKELNWNPKFDLETTINEMIKVQMSKTSYGDEF